MMKYTKIFWIFGLLFTFSTYTHAMMLSLKIKRCLKKNNQFLKKYQTKIIEENFLTAESPKSSLRNDNDIAEKEIPTETLITRLNKTEKYQKIIQNSPNHQRRLNKLKKQHESLMQIYVPYFLERIKATDEVHASDDDNNEI